MSDARILTVPQVADRLNLKPWTVRAMIQRGDLRASRFGKNWHIAEDDLQDALDRTANQPPARRRRRRASA